LDFYGINNITMKKEIYQAVIAIIIAALLITSCNKSIPTPTANYLWLKVVKNVTIRYTYAINDFHIVVYSDSTFQHEVIPPSPIYIQADVDGSMQNFKLTNPDTKILASESLRIVQVIYADKNTIFKF
jgi:hypothetical protein